MAGARCCAIPWLGVPWRGAGATSVPARAGLNGASGQAVTVLTRSVTDAGLRPGTPSGRDTKECHGAASVTGSTDGRGGYPILRSRERRCCCGNGLRPLNPGSLGLSKGVPSPHGDGNPVSLPTGGARLMVCPHLTVTGRPTACCHLTCACTSADLFEDLCGWPASRRRQTTTCMRRHRAVAPRTRVSAKYALYITSVIARTLVCTDPGGLAHQLWRAGAGRRLCGGLDQPEQTLD